MHGGDHGAPTGRDPAAGDASSGIDAVLVTPGPDLRYLVGYDAVPLERLTCLVIPAAGDPLLVAPRLEVLAAQASPVGALGMGIRDWGELDDPYALVASLVPGARRVAVDNHMWAEKVLALRAAMPGVEQVLAGPVISHLRMRKDPTEVAALVAAGAAIDRVHAAVPALLRPGRTEREVGADIADLILAEGHVRVDFIIVGQRPERRQPAPRGLRPGASSAATSSSSTSAGRCRTATAATAPARTPSGSRQRTSSPGTPSCRRRSSAAVEHARAGVTCESVDAAAREVLVDAGLGELFIHRTGHGIGLETHEDPYIVVGQHAGARRGHGVQHRARLLRRGPLRRPHRGHRDRHGRRRHRRQPAAARTGRGVMGHAWKGASVTRLMPTEESVDLMALVEDFAARELAPRAAAGRGGRGLPAGGPARARRARHPRACPFDAAYGGGEQPYEVTLQVLEELARAWMSIGVSVSVHYLACFPLAAFGTRRAARPLAGRHGRRRPARRLLPVGAALGLRRRGAVHPRGARRRRLRRQRHQGLDHPWRTCRLLLDDGAHVGRRGAGHHLPAGRRRPPPG